MTAAAPEVWTTPPGHTGFSALKVAGRIHAQIRDCAIAVIAPSGGGPAPAHVHAHDHLFVVLEGRITVTTDGKERVVDAFESIHVPGNTLHCVWNTTDSPAKVMGIGLVGESCKG